MKPALITATVLVVHSFLQRLSAAPENQARELYPPVHAALSRFEFLGPATHADQSLLASRGIKSWPAAIAPRGASRSWMTTMTLAKWIHMLVGDFPAVYKDEYEPEKELGRGQFGVVFQALDKKTGETVAVKLFQRRGREGWLTGADYEENDVKEQIDLSKKECLIAMDIQRHGAHSEGGSHVVKCLKDGISEAIEQASSDPLFIVMEFAGATNLDVWWKEKLQSVTVDPDETMIRLRSISRQMMQGLRFLNAGDQKYIHHDLKPDNMVVKDVNDSPHLTLIDLGFTLTTADPAGTSLCHPFWRPPEFLGIHAEFGFKPPPHSYDTFGAALSIIDLASTVRRPGATYTFMVMVKVSAQINSARMKTLVSVGKCWAKKMVGHDRSSSDAIKADFAFNCLDQIMVRHSQDAVEGMLMGARRALKSGNKQQLWKELVNLVGCKVALWGGQPEVITSNEEWHKRAVSEWVESGFGGVLLAMLATAPEDRPPPTEVLDSKWLQEDYGGTACPYCISDFEPTCTKLGEVLQGAHIPAHLIYFGMLLLSLVGCFCCACCGAGCSLANGAPSAIWTGLALAACVVGGGCATNIWLGSGLFLILPALVLASATVCLGINFTKMRPAWIGALASSALWCLGTGLAVTAAFSPVMTMKADMMASPGAGGKDFGDLLSQTGLPGVQPEMLPIMVVYTLVPSICGLFFAAFGLFCAVVKRNEDEARSPAIEVQGVQLEDLRKPDHPDRWGTVDSGQQA